MSAKWPGLPAFLANLAIGACLAMPVNTFVQYYFNGRLMAQLPQWDASIYSHAVIMPMDVLGVRFTALLCTTEPFTVSNDGYLELKKPTTAIMATGVIANRVHVRWKWLDGTNDYDAGVWNASAAAVIWSNYDLVDAAGNVYLKASEPVPRAPIPVLPEPDPDPEPERKPIAYKYNGVQLPDINTVWTDKETYPYACIFDYREWGAAFDVDFAYMCVLSDTAQFHYVNGDDDWVGVFGCRMAVYTLKEGETTWMLSGEQDYTGTNSGTATPGDYCVWSNADVVSETDGTVYLAASEPIPVYE